MPQDLFLTFNGTKFLTLFYNQFNAQNFVFGIKFFELFSATFDYERKTLVFYKNFRESLSEGRAFEIEEEEEEGEAEEDFGGRNADRKGKKGR